ncbi:MAG: TonB-dependent receptor plug domain-containing protein [Opitutaceae bacterium]
MPLKCRRPRFPAALSALCLSLLAAGGAAAQTTPPAPEDLTTLNLDELGELNISAAAKRTEPVFDTSSAVSVITSAEMLRYGLDDIADALRLVPGVEVMNESPFRWTVSVRGFDGLTSNKLLVLLDGRSIYSPFYGGVDWAEASLPVENLDHIEVVRGPGATLWGANAANGIINIISKSARDTQGGLVSIREDSTVGTESTVQYGWQAGSHTWARVYASVIDTQNALDPPPSGETQDYFREIATGFRIDSEPSDELHLTVQGDYQVLHHYSILAVPLPDEPADIGDTRRPMNILGRLTWHNPTGDEFTVQLYAYAHPDSATAGAFAAPGGLPLGIVDRGNSEDLDFSDRIKIGTRQDFLWGGGVRRDLLDLTGFDPDVLYLPEPRVTQMLANLFAQDEIALIPGDLRLTVGTKVEHDPYVPTQVLPSVRLTWMPAPSVTGWLAVSRAIRTPFVLEREAHITYEEIPAAGPYPPIVVALQGSSQFHQENLVAYEAGWRWRSGTRFSVDVSTYLNRYTGLRDFTPTQTLHLSPYYIEENYNAVNAASATGYGAEASAIWRVTEDWRIVANYTAEKIVASTSSLPPLTQPDYAEPEQMASLRSSIDLPRDWEVSVLGAAVGRLQEYGEPDVPGYFRVDAQVVWRPTDTLEFDGGVQNALQGAHFEAPAESTYPAVAIRRDFFVRTAWRF